MNKTLMQIVLDCLAFLELTDDDVLDADAAVRQMEAITASLRQLSVEEQREFLQFASERAESLRSDPTSNLYVAFLDQFPGAFGPV